MKVFWNLQGAFSFKCAAKKRGRNDLFTQVSYIVKKGFYGYDDVNAVKAMALFIRKYGKKELLKTMDWLHKEHDFEKVQEILGNDLEEGFGILEKTRDGNDAANVIILLKKG